MLNKFFILLLLSSFASGLTVAQQNTPDPNAKKEIYLPIMTKEQKAEQILLKRANEPVTVQKQDSLKQENSIPQIDNNRSLNKTESAKEAQNENTNVQMQSHRKTLTNTEIEKVKVAEIETPDEK